MKSFVVIGLGRFGTSIAETLYQLGNEVLAIDRDEEKVQDIANSVTQAVIANIEDEGMLKQLGVQGFECGIVAMGGNMEDSILATLLLKEIGVKHVVSKAQSQLHGMVLRKVGADNVIFPEWDMGIRVANSLSLTNMIDFLELAPDYSIVEVAAPVMWIDKTLMQLSIRAKYNVNVIGIKRDNKMNVSPGAQDKILAGDRILAMGTNENLSQLIEMTN